MISILNVPVSCSCGWSGVVGDCEPDAYGDGALRCPECLEVVEVEDDSSNERLTYCEMGD